MAQSGITEAELNIVYGARAQSRLEAATLERLNKQLKASYVSSESVSENEFNRRWPEICSEAVRLQTYRRFDVLNTTPRLPVHPES